MKVNKIKKLIKTNLVYLFNVYFKDEINKYWYVNKIKHRSYLFYVNYMYRCISEMCSSIVLKFSD